MTDTETSTRRAEANRRNAQKSTGPRTPEGKARSRFNALKHGMRAESPVLPGEDPEAREAREVAWAAELGPRDEVERFLVHRAVQLSWQLDRADRAQSGRSAEARCAADGRLTEVVDEVLSLGRRLFWDPRGPYGFYPHWRPEDGAATRVSWSGLADDPDDPARLVNRLESSAMGCAWLLDRWGELRHLIEAGRAWQPPDRFKAIRMLGHQPMDVLEDRRVLMIHLAAAAIDPGGPPAYHDLARELEEHEARRLVERLDALDAAAERPADVNAGRRALLEIVAQEVERLEAFLAAHLAREQAARDAMGFDDSAEGERLRRHQASCDRTLLRILEGLRRRHREAGGSGAATRAAGHPEAENPPRAPAGLAATVDLPAIAAPPVAASEPSCDRIGPADPGADAPAPPPCNESRAEFPVKPAPTGDPAVDPDRGPSPALGSFAQPVSEAAGRRAVPSTSPFRLVLGLLLCSGLIAASGASMGPPSSRQDTEESPGRPGRTPSRRPRPAGRPGFISDRPTPPVPSGDGGRAETGHSRVVAPA